MSSARVTAIVGPTGSGKSSLAMQMAASDPAIEIVAIDAFTVYRGMDIGTAKPSPADQQAVPHHCVDLVDPDQDVSVAWFRDQARAAIAGITLRGGHAVLVGGSGLYFRAVVDNLDFPPTDGEVRKRLLGQWEAEPEAAHQELAQQDGPAASRIDPGNVRRTVRALEVIELTGRAFSSFATDWDDFTSIYADLRVVAVDPLRDELAERIDRRTEAMLGSGLFDEAAELRSRFELSRTASKAIGYAECFAVMDGDLDREVLGETIATRTRQYARRQRAWFRKDPRWTGSPGDPAPADES